MPTKKAIEADGMRNLTIVGARVRAVPALPWEADDRWTIAGAGARDCVPASNGNGTHRHRTSTNRVYLKKNRKRNQMKKRPDDGGVKEAMEEEEEEVVVVVVLLLMAMMMILALWGEKKSTKWFLGQHRHKKWETNLPSEKLALHSCAGCSRCAKPRSESASSFCNRTRKSV